MAEDMSQAQKYHFKRQLEEIASRKGMHTELVTVYIPPERPIFEVMGYLRNEVGQASNIKSKQTRKNVTGALESMIQRLKLFKETPQNGLACFVGEVVVGNNQTRMFAELFEPPQPVPTFFYRCDNRFYIEPLEGMLVEKEVYALFLIDRREWCLGILTGKHVQPLAYRTSQVPGKHGRGGQSQRRFERLTEEAAHHWYKECGDKASEILLQYKDLVGIFLGGPGPSKRDFVDGGFLHHEVQRKIIEPYFDTGYTDEYGLRELAGMVSETQSQLSLSREKKLMQRMLREITKPDTGLAVYGHDHVRAAITMGALDTLIVSEDLRQSRLQVQCTSCGFTGHVTRKREAGQDPEPGLCPKCQQDTLTVNSSVDLVDELGQMAEAAGGTVELVGSDSEEGETLIRAFGGIAGILRYRADIDKVVAQGGL